MPAPLAIVSPGQIARNQFLSGQTHTSQRYEARKGSDKAFIIAWASQNGTFQFFLEDLEGNEVAWAAANAVALNVVESAEFGFPLNGILRVKVRFVNTSGLSGTFFAYAHDNADVNAVRED